jgi:hypothetical protein
MHGDTDFFNVTQLKEAGMWPFTFLSAYGMMPYLKRMQGELTGLEIGVLKAENMVTILENCENVKMIYGIDPFKEHMDYDTKRTKEQMKAYEKLALENLSGFEGNYRIIKKTSKAAAKDFGKDEQFDFILLDGDHTYNGIKNDLKLYYPLLKKGGHMFVHDTNCEDVINAVLDFKNENKLRMPLNHSKNFISFWIK